jgi:hypothetical protein
MPDNKHKIRASVSEVGVKIFRFVSVGKNLLFLVVQPKKQTTA